MKKQDILSVAIKIMGISYFIQFVFAAALSITQLQMALSNCIYIIGAVVGLILMVVTASFLLQKSDYIANKLISDDKELTITAPSGWEKAVFVLALRITGLICLIKVIPGSINVLINLAYEIAREGTIPFRSYRSMSLIGAIVQILIGVYLISGGATIVNFTYKHKNDKKI